MKVTTGWLSPPDAIGGLDHLGTQTPCQLIYQQLLPGITNVTDRARYYSLYPWLIWSFDKRHPNADAGRFVELFRRADFLLTLIAERHAQATGEPDFLHGAAMVGRTQLPTAFERLESDGVIDLDEFATREKVQTRYFKAKLGGLGQYYLGTLVELQLLDTANKEWIEYTSELGLPIAEAVESDVTKPKADQFWRIVESGSVTAKDLNALSSFCPCGLKPGTKEHALLEELFFVDREEYAESGSQRRASIAMLLHLASSLVSRPDAELEVGTFRSAVYTGHLPGGESWSVPRSLADTAKWWGIYQANELLSISFLSLLASALYELERSQANGDTPFQTIEQLADFIATGPIGRKIVRAAGTDAYEEYVAKLRKTSPALGDWENPKHEQQLAEELLGSQRRNHEEGDPGMLVQIAFELLALLATRLESSENPYEGLLISGDDLHRYPINLQTYKRRTKTWQQATVREVLRDLVHWSLVTHLHVSLRKLRQTGRSTFRFRPGELGLELTDDVPPPTRTTPRFNTTTQMLVDLGALRPLTNDRRGAMEVTALGRSWLERHLG